MDREILKLYAVTAGNMGKGKELSEKVRAAIEGGATCIQLREKEMSESEFLSEAIEINSICRELGVPLIINDNIDVMIKSGAAGVHLGQKDLDALAARRLIGDNKIIGVSARTAEQAQKAERDGADYLGCGAVFGTNTKSDAEKISVETLKEVVKSVNIPVVAIGGITEENITELKESGIAGVAVVSSIFAKEDVKAAAEKLAEYVKGYIL